MEGVLLVQKSGLSHGNLSKIAEKCGGGSLVCAIGLSMGKIGGVV